MSKKNDEKHNIKVISRAASILRLLARDTDGLSLGQIANGTELPRSTVQRIVTALAAEGFVSKENGSGGIRLGPEIQNLSRSTLRAPKDRFRPIMEQITKATRETVDLSVLQGERLLFIDQIVGNHRLRTASSVGETFPLTTTANGKAALACLGQSEAARLVLAEFQSAEHQGRDLTPLLQEIDAIRDGGLAQDQDEHSDGISALGFAVEDPSGDIYAVSVPVPSNRFERIKDGLAETLKAARLQCV